MLKAHYKKHTLHFKQPSQTSRDTLYTKDTYYLFIHRTDNPEVVGIGECSTIVGLSPDPIHNYTQTLHTLCKNINKHLEQHQQNLQQYPSILFGLETALQDLQKGGERILYPSAFTDGKDCIRTNGLVWMGDHRFMLKQIQQKIEQNYHCIKIKIGGINFDEELHLIRTIRNKHPKIEIRLDANGAYTPQNIQKILQQLAPYNIHSIEQPIKQGQVREMADLCKNMPIPIALDEELISINTTQQKTQLLQTIQPQYIILKPSLLGGIAHTQEWINLAKKSNIGWWITSALESNIGLNAIAQYTYCLAPTLPQGLGTGQLYTNNIASPLYLKNDNLYYNKEKQWNISLLKT